MEAINSLDELKEKYVSDIAYIDGKLISYDRRDESITYEVNVSLFDIFAYYYIDRKYLPLDGTVIDQFNEEFYKDNAQKILDSAKEIIYIFSGSRSIFDYCFNNKMYEYLFQSELFERWLYEKIELLADDDPIVTEIEEFVNGIIASVGNNIPKKYANSLILCSLALEQGKIDLFMSFNYPVRENFDEEFLKEYYDDFYNYLNHVPSFLEGKKSYFDYILEKNRGDLLCHFESEFITAEIFSKYKDEFKKFILDNKFIPDGLKNNQEIMDFLFESKMYNLMLDMSIPVKVDYFKDEEFYNFFKSHYKYSLGVNKNSKEILKFFLSKKEYEYAFYNFESELFDVDIMKEFPDIFTNDKSYVIKMYFKFDFKILEYFLTDGDLFMTPVKCFSDDDLYNAMIKYPEKMLSLILEKTLEFRENYSAFTLLLEEKRFDVASSFADYLFDEDLLDEFGDDILNYLEKQEYIYGAFNNAVLFKYAALKGKFSLLKKFNREFFTEDIYTKYAEEILLGFNGSFPYSLENDVLFEKAIELGLYSLAVTYHFIRHEHIDKYFDELLLGLKNTYSYALSGNEYFISKCIEKNVPELFDLIKLDDITDEFVLAHKDRIIEEIKTKESGTKLFSAPAVFRFAMQNGMSSLITKFYMGALDDQYILDNIEFIDSLVINELPQVLYKSTNYLKYCIDNDRKQVVNGFYCEAYDNLDDEYLEKFIKYISFPLGSYVGASYRVLEYFLDRDDFTYINDFRDFLFGSSSNFSTSFLLEKEINAGKERLNKYFTKLYKYSLQYGLPEVLKSNALFLNTLLKCEQYTLLDQFEASAWPIIFFKDDYNYIVKYIDTYNNGIVPSALVSNDNLRQQFFDYNREDLFLQCILNVKSEEMLKRYARKLNYSYDEFKNKIDYLLARNDELFNTVLPKMFEERMGVIDFKHLEKIMLYPELQFKLINMSDVQLRVMSKVFDLLDSDSYDLSGVIVEIINNLSLYEELIKDIDFDKINDNELVRLLTVLSRKDNLYGISKSEDLELDNYKKLKQKYFANITKRIKDNSIGILELKEALLQKKFGLSLEKVAFIVERYCHSLDSLKHKDFDKRLYTVLNELNRIYTSNDVTLLKYLYIKSRTVDINFFTSVSLESAIRQNFAKIYSDSLYKVKAEHNVVNDINLKETNGALYDKLTNLTYNDKNIPVYVMDGDFRLQIHALGAYRNWSRPDNFKQDWERPKIAYHGICTSYIANNQIANARATHPILGFDNYSSNSLLCAGNYDLFSDYAIQRYDSAMYKPYRFYLPDDMIDNTRHTHNEMVIERRNNVKGSLYKRLPNYVVMLVDDINNMSNYEGELWDEYCQAASDYEIPIVIVDRLKYAKLEYANIEKLEQEFYNGYDEKVLHKIVVNFANNMIGCTCFDSTDEREYHKIFSQNTFSELISRLYDHILQIEDEQLKIRVLLDLYNELKKEKEKGGYVPSLDKVVGLLRQYNVSFNDEDDKKSADLYKESIINHYYYNSSEEVQERLEEDINNGVDINTIVININSGYYERRFKL